MMAATASASVVYSLRLLLLLLLLLLHSVREVQATMKAIIHEDNHRTTIDQ